MAIPVKIFSSGGRVRKAEPHPKPIEYKNTINGLSLLKSVNCTSPLLKNTTAQNFAAGMGSFSVGLL